MARPAAEIEPQACMLSSSSILPGPMRLSGSRSIRKFSKGSDRLDEAGISHSTCLEDDLYIHIIIYNVNFLSLNVQP